ncbi:MAG: rRNA maturation RNase YbeY [Anaerolineaceae bacterium]|nr:rRNA maturation RNase YbeY [Anaerolineaceae bacterium]
MYLNKEEISETKNIDSKKLEEIAQTILKDYFENIPDFTLMFVTDETIRELNKNYRETDSVTDVLSFESDGEIDPETGREYLGDIVICLEQARRQAEQSGHPVENEIALLEIHGLLHLLGYDHLDKEQHDEMWKYQNMYLDQCGIQLNRRPGEDFDF